MKQLNLSLTKKAVLMSLLTVGAIIGAAVVMGITKPNHEEFNENIEEAVAVETEDTIIDIEE